MREDKSAPTFPVQTSLLALGSLWGQLRAADVSGHETSRLKPGTCANKVHHEIVTLSPVTEEGRQGDQFSCKCFLHRCTKTNQKIKWVLGQKTYRGPFQPQPFCEVQAKCQRVKLEQLKAAAPQITQTSYESSLSQHFKLKQDGREGSVILSLNLLIWVEKCKLWQ